MHIDHMFMGDEMGGKTLAILEAKFVVEALIDRRLREVAAVADHHGQYFGTFSKSDGVLAWGVQTIQATVRTLRSAIEEKWMVKFDRKRRPRAAARAFGGRTVRRKMIGSNLWAGRREGQPAGPQRPRG